MLAFLVFALAGCVIPVPETPIPAATLRPGISDPMLTAAAKTIVADLQSLNTLAAATEEPEQQAMSLDLTPAGLASPQVELSTEPPPAPIPPTVAAEFPISTEPLPLSTATSPAPPPPTAAPPQTTPASPTPTQTVPPAPPATPFPPPTATPTAAAIGQIPPAMPAPAPIVVAAATPIPFLAPIREYGEQFMVKEILISACANGTWTVFRILNLSQDKLESLSLHIQDLSTGTVLAGPWISNSPFHNNAQNCAVGDLDLLNAGREMYLSQMPGGSGLTGHRLRATLKLCAKEDLTDKCTQRAVEFIYP